MNANQNGKKGGKNDRNKESVNVEKKKELSERKTE